MAISAAPSAGHGLDVFAIRHGQALHNVAFQEKQSREIYFEDPHLVDSPLTLVGHREAAEVGNDASSARFWARKGEVTTVLVSPLARTLQTASNLWRAEIERAGFAFPAWDSPAIAADPQAWVRLAQEAAAETRRRAAALQLEPGSMGFTDEGRVTSLDASGKSEFLSPGAEAAPDAAVRVGIAAFRRRLPVRFVALEQLREYAMGMAANERKPRSQLAELLPWVDFSFLQSEADRVGPATIAGPVESGAWELTENGHRFESMQTFYARIRDFKRIMLQCDVLARLDSPPSVNLLDFDRGESGGAGGEGDTSRSDTLGFTASRLQVLFDFLHAKEERLALVSHSGFLAQMCFNIYGDESRPLKHVFPYHYTLDTVEQTPTVPDQEWEKERF